MFWACSCRCSKVLKQNSLLKSWKPAVLFFLLFSFHQWDMEYPRHQVTIKGLREFSDPRGSGADPLTKNELGAVWAAKNTSGGRITQYFMDYHFPGMCTINLSCVAIACFIFCMSLCRPIVAILGLGSTCCFFSIFFFVQSCVFVTKYNNYRLQ